MQMANSETNASERIDERIRKLDDWRGKTLSRVRGIIRDADPDVVEEWKWAKATSPGTPVWSHNGGICTGETYKSVVKLTFFKGASLDDPSGLFNSSLEPRTSVRQRTGRGGARDQRGACRSRRHPWPPGSAPRSSRCARCAAPGLPVRSSRRVRSGRRIAQRALLP